MIYIPSIKISGRNIKNFLKDELFLVVMCLQIPGKVIEIKNKIAIIDYDIEKREAAIADIKPNVGDWVLVVGQFIVDIVPEENALISLEHWKKTMLS